MPIIDVVDSTWFAARPAAVAAVVAEPANWRRWWPGLTLTVDEWRGDKGVRWSVPAASGRAAGLSGSAEVWLEPMAEGVVGHFFLRLDPPAGTRLAPRRVERIARDYRIRTKRAFWTLADELDPIDARILDILQQDAGLSVAEVADRVG
ncbi:MAG: AsnC family protein, partial [Actinobacteria bacterium]|nr:AsnC family protein [Actinomycetota bacterium]